METGCEDLQVEADGFGTIAIRRSKTDQEGVGAMAPITADAMRHLLAWIDAPTQETSRCSLANSTAPDGDLSNRVEPTDI